MAGIALSAVKDVMRYKATTVEFIKSKAKLLKRYLSDPVMEAPQLTLTDIQQMLSRGLGYSNWAEFTSQSAAGLLPRSDTVPNLVFKQLVDELSAAICRSLDLSAALIFRIGFFPENRKLSLDAATLPVSERELLFDILVDRMVELEHGSQALSSARSRLIALYRVLVDEIVAPSSQLILLGPSESSKRSRLLMDQINSVTAIFAQEGEEMLQRDVYEVWRSNAGHWQPTYRRMPMSRLLAPFVSGQLPRKGLLVMTGGTGSGRTLSAILLSLADRKGNKQLFPTFLRLYNDPFDNAVPAGYYGEVLEYEGFAPLVRDAENQLVIVQLGAGRPESAYHRTREGVAHVLGLQADAWIERHFIGGYHHDFTHEQDHSAVRDSLVSFWKAADAKYLDAWEEKVEIAAAVQL